MSTTTPPLTEVTLAGWDVRLRMFRAGDEVDTFALVTQRYLIVIDTMATPEHAAAIVALLMPERQGRQLLVVNTHADWDHCWGNAVFAAPDGLAPAPILASERAARRLLGPAERATLARKQREESRFANVHLVPPTLAFRDGLRIAGGDLTVELLPTPGHTPDHVSAWVPELRLLLPGDAAEHPFPEVTTAAGLAQLRASLERMRALAPTLVLPCHGGTTDPGLLDRNLAYFAWLERGVHMSLAEHSLPGDWATLPDLSDRLGLPFSSALVAAGAPAEAASPLYQQFHRDAVRATVETVLGRQHAKQ